MSQPTYIYPENLPDLECQLLDVRRADDFEASHLEGAASNCVFEVAFVDRLEETAPDPARPTVVYGSRSRTNEGIVAADKLRRNGYTDIRILKGGLEAAEQAGLPVVRGAAIPEIPAIADGVHEIDLEESKVEWLGRNLINKHWGTAALESGHLTFEGGNLVGGQFVIDLNRLTCADLEGSDLHDVLIAHLQNEDFFDVANHPRATFTITGVSDGAMTTPGAPNLKVTGDLTLRGQTHPITFSIAAGLTPEGCPAAQAAFSIDRTRWGAVYGSGKFFHRLAGHLVNDHVDFQLRIVIKPYRETMDQPKIADRQPVAVELEEGKTYAYCTCGLSATQPFCDGSHQGTEFTPDLFKAEKSGQAWLCQCKHSGNSPFCDGSHARLEATT
jgi:CDGSH-type Zn-finger protein/rhodanese-related sulfurtransferase